MNQKTKIEEEHRLEILDKRTGKFRVFTAKDAKNLYKQGIQKAIDILKELKINHKVKPINENTIEVNGLKCNSWNQEIIQPKDVIEKLNQEIKEHE